MVTSAQESVQHFLADIPQYFDHRALLVEQCKKYGNIGDCQLALLDNDYKQLLLITNGKREIRNTYWIINHLLLSQ